MEKKKFEWDKNFTLTCSNLSLFLTCWATKREASIVFSISRYDGFSNVGLTSPQQFGLKSLIPGLKSSSSPLDSGNGSAGNGGSPKRDGGSAIGWMNEKENENKLIKSDVKPVSLKILLFFFFQIVPINSIWIYSKVSLPPVVWKDFRKFCTNHIEVAERVDCILRDQCFHY